MRCAAAIVAAAAAISFGAATELAGQGSCEVNNQASCVVGGTATFGITLTVTTATRLAISATEIALGTPTGTHFDAGFGAATSLGLTMRANTTWAVSIQAAAATWTAVGALARTDRPAADLQWFTVVGGPYTDMTTSAAPLTSGAATAGTGLTVFFRARYQWQLDSPGDYSLPLQLTITAP